MIELRNSLFGNKLGKNVQYLTFDVLCLIIFVINIFCLALSNNDDISLQGRKFKDDGNANTDDQPVTKEGAIRLHVAILSVNIAIIAFWLYYIKNVWLQIFSFGILIASSIAMSRLLAESSSGKKDSGIKQKPIDAHEVALIYISLTLALSMSFFLWTVNSHVTKLPSSTEEIVDIITKTKRKRT